MKENILNDYNAIMNYCLHNDYQDPILLCEDILKQSDVDSFFISGASFLTTFKNCGGQIDLEKCLLEFQKRYKCILNEKLGINKYTLVICVVLSIIDSELKKDIDIQSYAGNTLLKISKYNHKNKCNVFDMYVSLSNATGFVNAAYDVKIKTKLLTCSNLSCTHQSCLIYNIKE